MKIKQHKNGQWTMSGITNNDIITLAKALDFANKTEMLYCNHIEKQREMIDELRADDMYLHTVCHLEFFMRCLSNEINNK